MSPLTILVVTQPPQKAPSDKTSFKSALKTSLVQLQDLTHQPLRLLTEAETDEDFQTLQVGADMNSELHVFTSLKSTLDTLDTQIPKTVLDKITRYACLFEMQASSQPLSQVNKTHLATTRDKEALAICDALVVYWDGTNDPDNRITQVVLSAIQHHLPIVWISHQSPENIQIIDLQKLTAEGQIALELANPSDEAVTTYFSDFTDDKARQALQTALNREAATLDTQTCALAGFWYELFKWGLQPSLKSLKKLFRFQKPKPYFGPIEDETKPFITTPIVDSAFKHYDVMAVHYGSRHRDSVIWLYLLSAFAVFSAVAGSIYLWISKGSHFWGWAEVVAIATIMIILALAKKRQWHSRFLKNRLIAEQLRYAKMGLMFLHINRKKASMGYEAKQTGLSPEENTHQILSEQGLPYSAQESENNIFVASQYLTDKAEVLKKIIDDQADYHNSTANLHSRLHHRVHKISFVLFLLTVVAVISHFFIHLDWLLIFTAALPALAAALHGILTKLEWSRIHHQSKHTHDQLILLKGILNEDLNNNRFEKNSFENLLYLRSLCERAAHIMSEENNQWQSLLSSQEPEIPA